MGFRGFGPRFQTAISGIFILMTTNSGQISPLELYNGPPERLTEHLERRAELDRRMVQLLAHCSTTLPPSLSAEVFEIATELESMGVIDDDLTDLPADKPQVID